MILVKRWYLARIAYLSVLVYLVLLCSFLWFAHDSLQQIFFQSQAQEELLDMRILSDALLVPVRNNFCAKTANPERRLRYNSLFNLFIEEEFDRQRKRALDSSASSLLAASSSNFASIEYPWREDGEHIHPMKTFIAINLHNNQDVIPDFLTQLLEVVQFLGRKNIFISIYESGSDDKTKTYLRFMEIFLSTWQVDYVIRASSEHRTSQDHRIEYLARMRNEAMRPLYENHRTFKKVLFLNDIFFCADDIKEMLYQSVIQRSDLTCALDYDVAYPEDAPELGFYDTWVARDIQGRSFVKQPLEEMVQDEATNARYNAGLPFQVQCCWNGVVVLNAEPFYPPYDVRFRREFTTPANKETTPHLNITRLQEEFPGKPIYANCSSSEINVLCKDLKRNGFDRSIVVPRSRVAYEWSMYDTLKKTYDKDSMFDPREDDVIRFRPQPQTVDCLPMYNAGVRGPDGLAGIELNE